MRVFLQMCVRVSKYVYVCVCVMLVGTLSCKKKSVLLKVFFFFPQYPF